MTHRLVALAFLSPWLLTACGHADTAEFSPPKQLPKAQRPTEWGAPADQRLGLRRPGPDGGAAGGEKVWVGDTPAGFVTKPPARFRDAVWAIPAAPDADIYFTAGVGGGVTGNLTRWYRDQFGLGEVPAPEALPVVELAGKPARLAELRGTFNGKQANWAALIAFYAEGEQVSSLKFTGPQAVVEAHRDAFLALAKSLRSASPSPDAKAPPIEPGQPMPPGHPPVPGSSPQPSSPHNPESPHGAGSPHAAPAAGAAPFTATAPAGWTAKTGTPRPLHHTFGADGEVYVSQLGGSLQQNLDIWRREMGQTTALSAADVEALPKVAFLGEDSVWLDLSGDLQGMTRQLKGARMLLAARTDGGTTTFAKLVGSAATVEGQVEAFRQFLGSVRRAQ